MSPAVAAESALVDYYNSNNTLNNISKVDVVLAVEMRRLDELS
jgi:hypothetical protein